MNEYKIRHCDSDVEMYVEAETAAKAKYKNYADWSEVFSGTFKDYLDGLESCKKSVDESGVIINE